MSFSKDFLWGAATAAYQIEGAYKEAGKGESIWDMFCRKEGAIKEGHDGKKACDHYNRIDEDIALMKSLGIKAYRLSLSWPRILPNGVGEVNHAGLDFYSDLIDKLIAAGIEPIITLYHWDLPKTLFMKGGWLNRNIAEDFANYAKICVEAFADRVEKWITLNEPQCFVFLGHSAGVHAPGLELPLKECLQAGHHALLAHGKAAIAMREVSHKIKIACAPMGLFKLPASENSEDIEAARKASFHVDGDHGFWTSWWYDPIYLGHYPQQGWKEFGDNVPQVEEGDMEIISSEMDFLATNFYMGDEVKAEGDSWVLSPEDPSIAKTAFDWKVTPSLLYWGPRFLYERYGKEIMITENGFSQHDVIAEDGAVHDQNRILYTKQYLSHLQRAVEENVPVTGYMHWSLMDNFEWGEGYTQRFGLTYINYETGERTIKDSGYWYRDLIDSNGALLKEAELALV
ncbi:beta-glucosidase [Lentisphaera araneosa HTCC2155]|uniref:Beta-glucosidase n=1 Tax=Lentisphaera araneosa HTCC2155 TaxID=313628 RepID=A6DUB8_9BACT|nr:GH1 family beta-glucosidase [Lentisphaera araneosa]EDM24761.1 beta-glucosidase [Lentisphaera araneosa HTCC2155]